MVSVPDSIFSKLMKIVAILAMDPSRLIGSKNGLPWHIPEDLRRFKDMTTWHAVVMGRNTYFSLPEKFRPLPNRRNIVLTRTSIEWIETYASIDEFLKVLWSQNITCFLIWGAQIYNQFFERKIVDSVELTLVDGIHDGDVYIDEFRSDFSEISNTQFSQWFFITLVRN